MRFSPAICGFIVRSYGEESSSRMTRRNPENPFFPAWRSRAKKAASSCCRSARLTRSPEVIGDMFSFKRRLFGGQKGREPIVVYGMPLCHQDHANKQIMRLMFTDDEEMARDPVFLRRTWDRLWRVVEKDDTEFAQKLRNTVDWNFPDFDSPLCSLP